jgi:hypothetical protein
MTRFADGLVEIDGLLRAGGAGQDLWSADLAAKREDGLDSLRTFLSERLRTNYGRTWTQFNGLMSQVADAYLGAGPSERAVLRNEVQAAEFVTLQIPVLFDEWTHQVSAEEPVLLRRALTLVSLLASAGDDQQLGPGLDWLWQRGQDAGFDVRGEMRKIAKLSSEPTRSLLHSFEPADIGGWPEPVATAPVSGKKEKATVAKKNQITITNELAARLIVSGCLADKGDPQGMLAGVVETLLDHMSAKDREPFVASLTEVLKRSGSSPQSKDVVLAISGAANELLRQKLKEQGY